MGAGGPSKARGAISDINVTPLVDVVLVLLIIFMVVGDLLADESVEGDIPIELPSASTSADRSSQDAIFAVAVDKQGRFIIQGKQLTEEELTTRIKQEIAERGEEMEVIVASDKDARHERFVRLLDLLREQGIYRFAIQTNLSKREG